MSPSCTQALAAACCGTVWHDVLIMPCVTSSTNSKPLNHCVSQGFILRRPVGSWHTSPPSHKLQRQPAAAGLAGMSATQAASLSSRHGTCSSVGHHSAISCTSLLVACSRLTSCHTQLKHHRHNKQTRVVSQPGGHMHIQRLAGTEKNFYRDGCYSSHSSAHHCALILP
jgi:hypothetical protein